MIKPTISDATIRKLTANQRDMLISHIDGEVGVSLVDGLTMVRRTLMDAGLIRGTPQGSMRPRYTALTERGRMAVAMILGDYADALVRAGLLAQENPLNVLRQLQASRNAPEIGGYSPEISFPGNAPGTKILTKTTI
jgi:hypothetical protein